MGLFRLFPQGPGREKPTQKHQKAILKQVQERQNLASDLKLGPRLLQIYEELSGELVRTRLERWACFVSNWSAKDSKVDFSLNGKPYSMKFIHYSILDDDPKASLNLYSGPGELIYSGYYQLEGTRLPYYSLIDTRAFIPGDWTKDFIALSILIDQEDREKQLNMKETACDDLKKRFGL